MRRGAFPLILFGTADKMEDTFIIRIGDYHGRSQAEEEKNLIMFPLGTVGRDMIYYLFTKAAS